MSDIDLKHILLEELDYTEASGLKSFDLWPNNRPIPHIEDIYFIQDVPIAYFSRLSDTNSDALIELYRQVWSQSKIPLLYVIFPQEIRIYNGYAEPAKVVGDLNDDEDRLLKNLQQLLTIETAREAIRSELSDFRRLNLETGAFWSTAAGQRIKRDHRADQRLLEAMNQVRHRLLFKSTPNNLSPEQAYALLGRSIFIRYLEDRGVLTSEWMLELTNGRASNYRSALDDLNTTNQLFERLSQRFNGDLFPPGQERKSVYQEHLNLLAQFLDGYNFETGQLSFWPYDFTHIPIELISGIYDTFLSDENRKKFGAYYTPLSLVEFVVEETLPLSKTHSNMKVLDPACGSGVFLVQVYRRLIAAWKRDNGKNPTAKQLGEILKHGIFGVDINSDAVQITAFSLYLTMLDYLKNEDITKEEFRFPNIKDNLVESDFFSTTVEQKLLDQKFDRIIGNLPWGKNTVTNDALQCMKTYGYKMGRKQIVQIFLQHAPKFCAENGEIALLAGAKSTIFVASSTHEEFRQTFFERYHVRALVNFSALVYELFPDSISPAIALFYQNGRPSQKNKIVYGVPKPSPLSQHLGAIVLDTTEVKYLDLEDVLEFSYIWKVAAWGTPRDANLIQRLLSFPRLRDLEEVGLLRGEINEGFIVGNKKTEDLWLQGKPFLDVNRFKPYIVNADGTVKESHFERPRSSERHIFIGPLALIHKSTCEAVFFSSGIVTYRNKISGVAAKPGQEYILKWLVAYINSPLAQYYHFLTSTSWAVERGTIIHDEYMNMPFFLPDKDDPRLKEILERFDQIVDISNHDAIFFDTESFQEHHQRINELVFDLYDLSSMERQLVYDVLNYEIAFFRWAKRKTRQLTDSQSIAIQRPDIKMLQAYAETFAETVTRLLRHQGQTLNSVVFQDGAPLSVVEFELANQFDAKPTRLITKSQILQDTLRKLDHLLIEQRSPTIYMRRHVRIYDGPHLYMVRPSERRFWTRSQARADADSFIVEMLNNSRTKIGVTD